MTGSIDPARLNRLLLAAERDIHRHGWDVPPQLLALVDTTEPAADRWCRQHAVGPTTRVDGYAAARCLHRQALIPYPMHVLFRLALNLRHSASHPGLTEIRQLLNPPGLLGLASVLEAWIRPTLTEQQQEQEQWGDRAAVDIPGAQESLFLVAATIDGSTFHVARIRGQKPTTTDDSSFDSIAGGGVLSLHTIVAAISGRPLPPETDDVPVGWDWDKELAP